MNPTLRFIPAMYRAAVVDLTKNQTRRVIVPQPIGANFEPGVLSELGEPYRVVQMTEGTNWSEDVLLSKATYGPPGTVKPVVATWAVEYTLDRFKPSEFSLMNHTHIWWNDGSPKPEWAGKSRPAMLFPKHLYPLARQARVVSVKAERVQSISAADAIAEGARAVQFPGRHHDGGNWLGFHNYQFETAHPNAGTVLTDDQHRIVAFASPVESYRTLWDSINAERGEGALKGQYAWKRNPWVFATTFEVLPFSES